MEFAGDLRLLEIFMEHAAERDEERRIVAEALTLDQDHRKKQTVQEKRARREKEEQEEREHSMLATAAQLDAFKTQLDDYDTATVQALMDNGRALDAVHQARQEIEASAYRLPDGRMVFKSDDCKPVFDQHGGEVSHDLIDPNDRGASAHSPFPGTARHRPRHGKPRRRFRGRPVQNGKGLAA